MFWTGWVISTLPALFLLMDGVMKLVKPPMVVKATVDLGYPEGVVVGLGLVLLACTLLYMIPKTGVLGAILLTGYLGGAVASHVRMGGSTFSICFPIVIGGLIWLGIYLREEGVRRLTPLVN